jgi:RNase P subunit RPR2
MRFCVHCRKPITQNQMLRARWKAIFCSPECKQEDRNAIRAAKKQRHLERGMCPACGHKRRTPLHLASSPEFTAVVA